MPESESLSAAGWKSTIAAGFPPCVNPDHLQLIEKSLHRGWRSDPLAIEVEDPEDSVEVPDSVVEIEAVEA
jgi:hypothetical protein